ncbi:MAG: iron-containing alcohol dehydrogenase [bacterium]|nr:iron-containing alcohol dehydrogenase [bacterium]
MLINKGFKVTYGRGIVGHLVTRLDKCLVVTMADVWPILEPSFQQAPQQLHFVNTLEITELEAWVKSIHGIEHVIGMGGGVAADVAKFVRWKKRVPLYQVPTIVSVDAFFTHEIAIRDGGVVKYIGDAVPERVFVDYEIIENAPKTLNRSGLGDILSCHTGLFDWKLAARAGEKPDWNESLAVETREILDMVKKNIAEVAAVSEKGIQMMIEVLNWIGLHCYTQGHPRFEEGSEHHFVYNLEYVTGKHFTHGQVVCLGIYILSVLQDNAPDDILTIIRDSGVDISLKSIDIAWEDVKKTLLTLKEFVIREKLPYSIIHEKAMTPEFYERIRSALS